MYTYMHDRDRTVRMRLRRDGRRLESSVGPCLPGAAALLALGHRRGIVTRLVLHHLLVNQLLPLLHRVLPLVYAVIVRSWRGLQQTHAGISSATLSSADEHRARQQHLQRSLRPRRTTRLCNCVAERRRLRCVARGRSRACATIDPWLGSLENETETRRVEERSRGRKQ